MLANFRCSVGFNQTRPSLSMAYLRLQKFAVQTEQSSVDYFDRLEQCFWLFDSMANLAESLNLFSPVKSSCDAAGAFLFEIWFVVSLVTWLLAG